MTNAHTPIALEDDLIYPEESSSIHPALILLINFYLPGVGHMLIGQKSKGASLFIVTMIAHLIMALLMVVAIGFLMLPFFIAWIVLIMIDGFKLSNRLYSGSAIGKGECYYKILTHGSKLLKDTRIYCNKGMDSTIDGETIA